MPIAAEGIMRETGFLPLGLREVGSSLPNKGETIWQNRFEVLKSAKANESIYAQTKVSVDALSEVLQARYLKLAVLLEGMAAPNPILQVLWHATQSEAEESAEELIDLSLARRGDGGIQLHDLQLDYVRSRYADQDTLAYIHAAMRLCLHILVTDPA